MAGIRIATIMPSLTGRLYRGNSEPSNEQSQQMITAGVIRAWQNPTGRLLPGKSGVCKYTASAQRPPGSIRDFIFALSDRTAIPVTKSRQLSVVVKCTRDNEALLIRHNRFTTLAVTLPPSRRDGISVANGHGADPSRPVRDGIFNYKPNRNIIDIFKIPQI